MFIDDELRDLQRATRRFVDDELIPNEADMVDGEPLPAELDERIRRRLMELGLWALGVAAAIITAFLFDALIDKPLSERVSKLPFVKGGV